MIVEHSFVSPKPPEELFAAARTFLTVRGFVPKVVSAETPFSLEFRRGRIKPARNLSILELPQLIRIDWDRGRVQLALSITPSVQTSFSMSVAANISPDSPRLRLHRALLTSIATGLEQFLADNQPAPVASAEWLRVEDQITHQAARDARWRVRKIIILILVIVLGPIIGCIILMTFIR